jgi:hypothetical protein
MCIIDAKKLYFCEPAIILLALFTDQAVFQAFLILGKVYLLLKTNIKKPEYGLIIE